VDLHLKAGVVVRLEELLDLRVRIHDRHEPRGAAPGGAVPEEVDLIREAL